MVYRRFGELFARVLHRKQDELSELEEGLHDIDRLHVAQNIELLMSRECDKDEAKIRGQTKTRQQLLDQIEQKLIGYSECAEQKARIAHH